MSRDDMRVADTFNWQQSIFGACHQESKTLLFVLEAKDFEEARAPQVQHFLNVTI